MPMLHGCAFSGCTTFTLSTYCIEHELLIRALKESERAHVVHPLDIEADAVLTATADDEAPTPELEPLGS
ncbi:MAG: hypothetical protein ACRDLM_11845 [Gaiellaceae bacterium]